MSMVSAVILSNLETLHASWTSVRDGDAEAIHDARVATRRLRAALALVDPRRLTRPSEIAGTIKAIGRALGKAREQDEAIRLIAEIEGRLPSIAPAAAALRERLRPEQLRQRRRLIKVLEEADLGQLHRLRDAVAHESARARRFWTRAAAAPGLAAAIEAGVAVVEKKVRHASGVYFPNRAHKARIAIKKLRYAVELIDESEAVRQPSIRVLRKAQDALGQAHDREVLLRQLLAIDRIDNVAGAHALAGLLEAESHKLFEEYRAMRPAVLAACAELGGWSRQAARHSSPRLQAIKAVGAVALPSAAVLVANRVRRAS